MADPRGNPGKIDYESLDLALGMEDGRAEAIHQAMKARELFGEDGSVSAWLKRQPKRERDDDKSTDRVKAFRDRQRHETPDETMKRQETPREEESREEEREESKSPAGDSAKVSDLCPHSAIVELYHTTLPTARRIRDWTPARQQALRSRWREKTERQTLDWWQEFFAYVAKSDFLCGRSPAPSGRKPFELSLDWLCKSENFVKVLEGAYES